MLKPELSVLNRNAAENNNNDDHNHHNHDDDHAAADDDAGDDHASPEETPQETVRARQPELAGGTARGVEQRAKLLRVQPAKQHAQRICPANRETKSASIGPAAPFRLHELGALERGHYRLFARDNCKGICVKLRFDIFIFLNFIRAV